MFYKNKNCSEDYIVCNISMIWANLARINIYITSSNILYSFMWLINADNTSFFTRSIMSINVFEGYNKRFPRSFKTINEWESVHSWVKKYCLHVEQDLSKYFFNKKPAMYDDPACSNLILRLIRHRWC
jgi:hypothetical protein